MKAYSHAMEKTLFPSDEELAHELPLLCAWLRDFTPDPAIWVGGRFGTVDWCHPRAAGRGNRDGPSTGLLQVIDIWRRSYFGNPDPHTQETKGYRKKATPPFTTTQLQQWMNQDENIQQGGFRFNYITLGQALTEGMRNGVAWIERVKVGTRRPRDTSSTGRMTCPSRAKRQVT